MSKKILPKDTFGEVIENAILASLTVQGKKIPEKFKERDISKEIKIKKKFNNKATQ